MSYLLLILATLMALFILILFILLLGLWMRGADALAIPGLGLIIATPLVLLSLFLLEAALVLLAAYLVRFTPLARLLPTGDVQG